MKKPQSKPSQDADPRVLDFFVQLQRTISLLQDILLDPRDVTPRKEKQELAAVEDTRHAAPDNTTKLSYSTKEVCKLVGVGHSTLYKAIGNRELRTVKFGRKTLILAKDLHAWLDGLPRGF